MPVTSPHPISLTPVQSSNLQAVGYDPDANVLAVQFGSGHIFHYANVPLKLWEGLEAAPSKGQFYAREIKGRFTAEKVTGTCGKCGDVGLIGTRCTDCGTADYVVRMV